jgi:uncharacterized protein YecT (DUF1311 family)
MKFLLALTFLLVMTSPSRAAAANDATGCEGPDTSTYYEACVLSNETKALDVELNQSYQKLLASRKSPSSAKQRQALIEAQRMWIRYRDKTCEFENEENGGINSISWVRCQNRMVRERLKYLKDFD